MKKNLLYITFILSFAFTQSCEEVIEIDLNSSNPLVVAEAYLNEDHTCRLSLSYTRDYFQAEEAHKIENALVSLSDDKGNKEVLTHLGDGLYAGSSIRGEILTDYSLSIEVEDEIYEGSTRLLPPADIAALYYFESIFQRPVAPGETPQKAYTVSFDLNEIPEEDDRYLVYISKPRQAPNDFYLTLSDEFLSQQGTIQFSAFMFEFFKGDTVLINIQSIDDGAYWYYNQMNDAIGIGPSAMSTPYNPASNLGENILGYFMARSVKDTMIIIQ